MHYFQGIKRRPYRRYKAARVHEPLNVRSDLLRRQRPEEENTGHRQQEPFRALTRPLTQAHSKIPSRRYNERNFPTNDKRIRLRNTAFR